MIVKKSPIQDLHRYHPCPEFLNALPQAFLSITSKESICDTTQTTQHFRKNFKHAARLAKKAALKPRFRMFLFFHLATSKPKFLPFAFGTAWDFRAFRLYRHEQHSSHAILTNPWRAKLLGEESGRVTQDFDDLFVSLATSESRCQRCLWQIVWSVAKSWLAYCFNPCLTVHAKKAGLPSINSMLPHQHINPERWLHLDLNTIEPCPKFP